MNEADQKLDVIESKLREIKDHHAHLNAQVGRPLTRSLTHRAASEAEQELKRLRMLLRVAALIPRPRHPDLYATVQHFNNRVVPGVDRTVEWLAGQAPPPPPVPDLALGVRLVAEEFHELMEACDAVFADGEWNVFTSSRLDVPEAVDAVCDLVYVLFGLLLRLGITGDQFYAAFAEVTRANLDKANGPIREDGKRLKPEGWTPPDIAGALAKAAPTD